MSYDADELAEFIAGEFAEAQERGERVRWRIEAELAPIRIGLPPARECDVTLDREVERLEREHLSRVEAERAKAVRAIVRVAERRARMRAHAARHRAKVDAELRARRALVAARYRALGWT